MPFCLTIQRSWIAAYLEVQVTAAGYLSSVIFQIMKIQRIKPVGCSVPSQPDTTMQQLKLTRIVPIQIATYQYRVRSNARVRIRSCVPGVSSPSMVAHSKAGYS